MKDDLAKLKECAVPVEKWDTSRGTRRVARPDVRWLDSAEEDFKTIGVKEAEVHHGL
jgi:hypothetical protein